MKTSTALKTADLTVVLTKADASLPAFIVTGPASLAVRAGTTIEFGGQTYSFAEQTDIALPDALETGGDYVVLLTSNGTLRAAHVDDADEQDDMTYIGGFHNAPGGNATGRSGGDSSPAINPFTCWDRNFHAACADQRGMTLVDGRFWVDIYLLNDNPILEGSSRFGLTIADDDSRPRKADGKSYPNLNFATASEILASLGKGLLSIEERFAAAFGVTEKTAAGTDPKVTGLDAARTSKWGLMQAAGNMWEWGHDGDPDEPRACLFGGSWWSGDAAGSRQASVATWPDYSSNPFGARGRSDHLATV